MKWASVFDIQSEVQMEIRKNVIKLIHFKQKICRNSFSKEVIATLSKLVCVSVCVFLLRLISLSDATSQTPIPLKVRMSERVKEYTFSFISANVNI